MNINKKLNTSFSKKEIEDLIHTIIEHTDDTFSEKIGKNYYITNIKHHIKITINSNTFRVITADKL